MEMSMSTRSVHSLLVAIAAVAALGLSACGSDKPTRLYMLSPNAAASAPVSPDGIPIGVGPITLPKYLDRPQMVVGTSANQLSQANLDQWGGDLNDNITRVLATNLSNLLGTERVSLYPWKDRAPVAYQVTMDITQFEVGADGAAELTAFWSITNPADGTVLTMRRSSYRNPVGSSTAASPASGSSSPAYDSVAAAMSRDLDSLSQDIAKAILGLKGS
jgi:uncharacterized protein